MDHEQKMGVNSKVLDQKQQNIFDRIPLFWSEELQGHPEQQYLPDVHIIIIIIIIDVIFSNPSGSYNNNNIFIKK